MSGTWNNGMMEYWNIGFYRIFSIYYSFSMIGFAIKPLHSIIPKRTISLFHYSNIPVFQYLLWGADPNDRSQVG
jgi:hypothetical protein